MSENQNPPTVFPTLRYRDPGGAIRFLTGTLGLTSRHVAHGPDGQVVHAELGWGNGSVLISPRGEQPGPFDTGRACLYLVTPDPDTLHDKAVAAGATVLMPLTDQEYGSREFAVEDPEGNAWCFGTYQPQPPR